MRIIIINKQKLQLPNENSPCNILLSHPPPYLPLGEAVGRLKEPQKTLCPSSLSKRIVTAVYLSFREGILFFSSSLPEILCCTGSCPDRRSYLILLVTYQPEKNHRTDSREEPAEYSLQERNKRCSTEYIAPSTDT